MTFQINPTAPLFSLLSTSHRLELKNGGCWLISLVNITLVILKYKKSEREYLWWGEASNWEQKVSTSRREAMSYNPSASYRGFVAVGATYPLPAITSRFRRLISTGKSKSDLTTDFISDISVEGRTSWWLSSLKHPHSSHAAINLDNWFGKSCKSITGILHLVAIFNFFRRNLEIYSAALLLLLFSPKI